MTEALIQHLSSLFETVLHEARERGDPAWRTQQRETAFARFLDIGFPTVRQESWKYTNVAPMTATEFVLPQPAPLPDVSSLIGEHREDEIEFVFVDGVMSREHSTSTATPGLELTLFRDAMANGDGEQLRNRLEGSAFGNTDAFEHHLQFIRVARVAHNRKRGFVRNNFLRPEKYWNHHIALKRYLHGRHFNLKGRISTFNSKRFHGER